MGGFMVRVICPHCNQALECSEEDVSCALKCPVCDNIFNVVTEDVSDTQPGENTKAQVFSVVSGNKNVETESPIEFEFSLKKLLDKSNGDAVDMIILGITAVFTIVSFIGMLYYFIFRNSISEEVRKSKKEAYEIISAKRCDKKLEQVGHALIKYAEKNSGMLPPKKQWKDACTQYADGDGSLVVCLNYGEFTTHFDYEQLANFKSKKNTPLCSCPYHKKAIFADGTLRKYENEVQK